jgi:hypothetical protein
LSLVEDIGHYCLLQDYRSTPIQRTVAYGVGLV